MTQLLGMQLNFWPSHIVQYYGTDAIFFLGYLSASLWTPDHSYIGNSSSVEGAWEFNKNCPKLISPGADKPPQSGPEDRSCYESSGQ